MDWGMANRIARIIKPRTGKTVMLAVDHGYFQGPTHRLENPRRTITPLVRFADSLMLTRGVLRSSVSPDWEVPVVLRVSGGTSMVGAALSNEIVTTSIEEAIRLNASAVAVSIFIGSEHERQTLQSLAELVNAGERVGLPVLAVTAVGRDMVRDARYLALCCRIAAELGARLVKTYYCDEFEKVVESCPVPVVIAGGKKLEKPRQVFELTRNAISEGAVGVDMGRNIWQDDHPVAMIKAVRAIVHDGASVEAALELFSSACQAR